MTQTPADAPAGAWHPLVRVLFRFALIYFLTYALAPELVWDPIIRGLGAALDVPVRYRPNGSGDTTYNQLQVLFGLGLALAASLVWSLIDRRTAHPRLAEALLIAARTYLAVMMLAYGFAKIIGSQFPAPGLELLVRPYGQLSPKGLVWGFMGQSLAYQIFTGLLEFVAGLLLLWRRTTTVGALLSVAVMSNVVMLNYCFDIPVKLLSSHLLLLAVILVAHDGRRLMAALLGLAPTEVVSHQPLQFGDRKLHIVTRVLQSLTLLGLTGFLAQVGWQWHLESSLPPSPYYGIYEVEELREDGVLRPAVLADGERWRWLVFEHPSVLTIVQLDGGSAYYLVEADAAGGGLTVQTSTGKPFDQFLLDPPAPAEVVEHHWRVDESSPGYLWVEGELEGKQLELGLRRVEAEFPLRSWGVHWISETPPSS